MVQRNFRLETRSIVAIAIPLLLIILSALYYFAELPHVRHGFDQSFQAYLALQMLEAGELVMIGQPSSVFLDNPPLMAYLVLLPLLLWRSIWSVYIFICLLNATAVWFVYDVARRLFDWRVALVAGALFATSPWIIYFGRMPWTQGLLPFFMAATAWGVWPHMAGQPCSRGRLLFGLLMAIAMMQTYILGIALIAPLAILLFGSRKRLPKRPLWVAASVFLVSFAIFGVQLAGSSGTGDNKFAEFMTQLNFQFNPISMTHAVRFITGLDYWGADIAANTPIPAPPLGLLIHWLLSLALAAGLVRAAVDLRDREKRPWARTLLVWFGVPIIGLSFLPFLTHAHYLLLTLPAGHLLAAYGVGPLLSDKRARWAVAALLLLFIGQWRVNLWRSGQAVAANPIWPDLNGWSLLEADRLGQTLRAGSASAHSTPRIITSDHPALPSSMAGRLVQTLDDFRYPDFIVIPADQPAQYVLTDQPIDPRLPLMQLQASAAKIPVLQTLPQDRTLAATLPQIPLGAASDSGLSLLGVTAPQLDQSDSSPSASLPIQIETGSQLTLDSYWYVDQLHAERAEWYVTFTYQLLDANGIMHLNSSQHGVWGYAWQQNDLLIERITLDVPPDLPSGQYRLLIILFDPLQNSTFNLQNPDGTSNVAIPISVK